ncbi:MAG: nitroreductase family protein, partial [Proteobacteria bacterium]|nr:nitroreductase family protein [Pseudomonadota bacterium]
MSLFKIDTRKCDKDGICAIECPAHIIKMTEEGPAPAAGAEEFCIRCGHCVAICPKGAFNLEFLTPDQCMPIEKELMLTPEHAEHFLRSRRSIRRYKDKSVPRQIFEKALSISCCAPTGSNRQTVKWLVLDKQAEVQKVAAHVIDWMGY